MCFLTCKGLEMMQYLNGFYRPVSKSMEIWESGNLTIKRDVVRYILWSYVL